ncbi:MAG: APC family permease [Actinomycetota bacterium]|nr:APC family permease [Actinomycetota bacterium]
MRGTREFLFYLSVGVGMALSCSAFMMVGGLFQVTTLFWALVALALGGLLCSVLAQSIGELAGMYPSSPAIVTYFKAAFGERAALAFVYLYLIFVVLIAGVESYLFALVMRALFPGFPALAIVVVMIVCVVAVNLLGLEFPRGLQMGLTGVAAALIVVLGIAGVANAPGDLQHAAGVGDLGGGLAALPAAVGIAVFIYMGFEWVTPIGLRPASYARLIPLSMPVAVVILAVAYGVFSSGIGANVARARLTDDLTPQLTYLRELLGRTGTYLAAFLSLSAIASTFNAGVMGASRLVYAVARDRHLPSWCAAMRVETGVPYGAVLLLGSLGIASAFFVVSLGIELVAAVIGAAIVCLIYAAYMVAVLRLRQSDPDRARPYRTAVPSGFQWAVIVLLVVIGIATLFSLPDRWISCVAGLVVATAAAIALSRWSMRRRGRAPLTPRRLEPTS